MELHYKVFGGRMMSDNGGIGLPWFEQESSGQADPGILLGIQQGKELGLVF